MEPSDDLRSWLRALPKAELHLHLGGALRWSTIRELHPRGAELPASPPWLPAPAGGLSWETFVACFRDLIVPATGWPEAIERHCYEVMIDLAAQGVCYAEPISGTRFHAGGGLSPEAIWEAQARGFGRARQETGIEVRVILGVFREPGRQTTVEELERELALAGPQGLGLIAGIDLQGDERLGDPGQLAAVFDCAARHGLRCKAHAGELGGPQRVREALALGADHLSHGTRAVEDPALLERLVGEGIWLHQCPTSNILLPVEGVPDAASHPLPALLEAGCRVTLNSDDPLLFGASLLDEYELVHHQMGLSRRQLAELARASLEASLLPDAQRAAKLAELDAILAELD